MRESYFDAQERDYQAEEEAIRQREKVLIIFPNEELYKLRKEARDRLLDAEQLITAIDNIINDRQR